MVDFSIKITGTAGSGIFTLGELISHIFKNFNYNVFYSTEFPSVIKGGHNMCSIRISDKDINSEREFHDVLICMNEKKVIDDIDFLKKDGVLITNSKNSYETHEYKIFNIEVDKNHQNMSFFSATSKILGFTENEMTRVIRHFFKKKSDEVIENNLQIINNSYDVDLVSVFEFKKLVASDKNKIFIDGNSAISIGAIKAGVGFVGEYPITPSTSILHYLMKKKDDFNIKIKQTEDEIASIMSIIGASTVGVRAMTATSGAGFSLMCEGIGMAATSETGVVIFNVQRGGSSTGLPTYTGQADLNLAVNISHSENNYIVLAPSSIEESFYMSFEAFNLADVYQVPVIVLTDKFLADSKKVIDGFYDKNLKIDRGKIILNEKDLPENYKRYEYLKDNISNRVVPGISGGESVISSYEHTESGFTAEDVENTNKMIEKRFKKLENMELDFIMPKFYGNKDSDLTIVCWGSTYGVVKDVIDNLVDSGKNVSMLYFNVLNPLNSDKLKDVLLNLNNVLIVEGNYQGQLRDLIARRCGVFYNNTFLKYDGRSFKFEEVKSRILEEFEK